MALTTAEAARRLAADGPNQIVPEQHGSRLRSLLEPLLQSRGKLLQAQGPLVPDVAFLPENWKKYSFYVALYHDQGLIPFKSLAQGEGINYTAGLPVIRTSPDHGTAFDIAGKNKGDAGSLLESIFTAVDIFNARQGFSDNRRNPLKKMTSSLQANATDERIEES